MSEQLPAVAKSFHSFCKKCDAERYHTVLSHPTATSAKMKCEVCGATSTYKLPKAGKVAGAKRPLAGAAAKRKEASANAKRSAHSNEYQSLMSGNGDFVNYTMKAKFTVNSKLQHPKFGAGFVKSVQPEKIEVVFEDEVRSLVHNRG